MAQIVRHEFVGSRERFFLLCVLGVTLPFAVIYLLEATVTVEEEIDAPETLIDAYRAGKVGKTL